MPGYDRPSSMQAIDQIGASPFIVPSAARGRNRTSEIGGGSARSALSLRQNFFAKRKEVTDKESIRLS